MNKPLVVIIIVSFIYVLSIALFSSQKVHGKSAQLEYGFVAGDPQECSMLSDSYSKSKKLHYVIEKDDEGMKINFFCFDEEDSIEKASE